MEYNKKQPTYILIAQDIINKILKSDFKKGDILPGVRTLAGEYKVTVTTVLNVTKYLEEKGVLIKRGTHGSFINMDQDSIKEIYIESAKEFAIQFVEKLKSIDVDKERAIQIIEEVYDDSSK